MDRDLQFAYHVYKGMAYAVAFALVAAWAWSGPPVLAGLLACALTVAVCVCFAFLDRPEGAGGATSAAAAGLVRAGAYGVLTILSCRGAAWLAGGEPPEPGAWTRTAALAALVLAGAALGACGRAVGAYRLRRPESLRAPVAAG